MNDFNTRHISSKEACFYPITLQHFQKNSKKITIITRIYFILHVPVIKCYYPCSICTSLYKHLSRFYGHFYLSK